MEYPKLNTSYSARLYHNKRGVWWTLGQFKNLVKPLLFLQYFKEVLLLPTSDVLVLKILWIPLSLLTYLNLEWTALRIWSSAPTIHTVISKRFKQVANFQFFLIISVMEYNVQFLVLFYFLWHVDWFSKFVIMHFVVQVFNSWSSCMWYDIYTHYFQTHTYTLNLCYRYHRVRKYLWNLLLLNYILLEVPTSQLRSVSM